MYRFLHNCVAHPMLFWSNDAGWAVRFHDWTADRMKQYKHDYQADAIRLWEILDDIDTASDMAKANDQFYRARVEHKQRKRFTVFTSDGYDLFLPNGTRITGMYDDTGMRYNGND